MLATILLALHAALPSALEEPLPLLETRDAETMLQRHYDAIAARHFAARRSDLEDDLRDPERIRARQERLRAAYLEALGPFPEWEGPVPVHPAGGGTGDGFRYEKIIYESLPGYFVPATLYLPEGPPDKPAGYPGVLVPCGHSNNGKAAETYQRASMLLARNGMAALCFDPIGQGERYHFLREDGRPRFGPTLQHTVMGVPCILTGVNLATYRIWDGMQGLSVLAEHPEIDAGRLACTGNSGGGTLTSYIMALDPRVSVAAPSCYITSFERLLATIGPQDAEQNIFGQVAFGFEHADYLHLRAPKPTLICAATEDFFDIGGTWDAYREAQRLFTRLGRPEAAAIVEAPGPHGFSQPLREGMAQWMRRWLMDDNGPIAEPELTVFSEAELQCTPEGQVIWMPGARSIFDLVQEREAALRAERARFWRETPPADALERVRETIVARPYKGVPAPEVRERGALPVEGGQVIPLLLRLDNGILLPAHDWRPDQPSGTTVLYLHEAGKESEAGAEGEIPRRFQTGARVFAVDLSGFGETASKAASGNWAQYIGPDWSDYYRAYLVGKSFVGRRTEDILACLRHIETAGPVHIAAIGKAAVPALHAAAFAPGRVHALELRGGIPSWAEVVATPNASRQLANAVHGALTFYDLPDLEGTLPEGMLRVTDTAVPVF